MPHMTQRNRKLIGAFLIVASIVAWSVLATSIYLALPEGLPGLVLILYFIIAGMGWLLPAMWLVRWMARPDAERRAG
jgi:Kef-type K+ transport system membrane component KefB